MPRSVLAALSILLALGAPATVLAQSKTVQYEFAITDCTAVALNATTTCEIVPPTSTGFLYTKGANLLTLDFNYDDNAGGGGTGYTAYLEYCNEGTTSSDCTSSSDWGRVDALSIAQSGIATMVPLQLSRSSDADVRDGVSIGINYLRMRIKSLTGTGTPGASDLMSARATLTYTPAF